MLDIMEMRGFYIVQHKTSGTYHLKTPGKEFFYLLEHPQKPKLIQQAFTIFQSVNPIYP